jgi:ABC-2 type transport system permease protein
MSAGTLLRPLVAQARAETEMTLRRGETLLLVVGIPVAFLLFFSEVHVEKVGPGPEAAFFAPGILALAVMSTSMVSLGIATGFERGYGVLKRLGTTPLGRARLLGAKIAAILVVEILQAAVLVPVGIGLGWHPAAHGSGPVAAGEALAVCLLATAAFGGLGLVLAGTLRAEVNLAAANGLYLVLLLLGGMIVPLAKFPGALADICKVLPAAALSDALHAALGSGTGVPLESWIVLAVWAAAAPTLAAATVRWE